MHPRPRSAWRWQGRCRWSRRSRRPPCSRICRSSSVSLIWAARGSPCEKQGVHGTKNALDRGIELQCSRNETMMAPDLNDYALFAEVVTHGGFAAAGRALRAPKSTLSRRIAALEARLGVRLIERSTRRFRVTEIGQAFYERCRAIMLEAEQAEAVVAQAQAEPHGRVRFSCPTGLVETLSPSLPAFLARYPKVRLQVVTIDRGVDLIAERIDVALRVRTALTR